VLNRIEMLVAENAALRTETTVPIVRGLLSDDAPVFDGPTEMSLSEIKQQLALPMAEVYL
jgi:hypothetical protein